MGLKKLIKRINEFSNADLSERRKKDHRLKKTLKALKHKYDELQRDLKSEKDSIKREVLEKKLKIVRAQRRKGIALRKELKDKKTKK
jgi:Skp family chaperone for outer membrane proteins